MQKPFGEGVAALAVGGELDFVDAKKFNRPVERHRFNRADEITRMGRQNFFFAGDERDLAGPFDADHTFIDFARQQPERQADHARRVPHHPLDGEMGFARVGRPEHRCDAGGTGLVSEGVNVHLLVGHIRGNCGARQVVSDLLSALSRWGRGSAARRGE